VDYERTSLCDLHHPMDAPKTNTSSQLENKKKKGFLVKVR
jgi:phage I-like protein